MFDRNKKYEPLVNSVKTIMEKSNVHREAETILNESLGIDSRNAVPYSQRPEYDRALEKTYLALLKENRTEVKKEFIKKAKENSGEDEEEDVKEEKLKYWEPKPTKLDRVKGAIKSMKHTAADGLIAASAAAAGGAMAGYPKTGAALGLVAGASAPVADAIYNYRNSKHGMFKYIKEEIRNNLIQKLNYIQDPEKLEEALNSLTQDQRELLGEDLSSVFDTGPSNQDSTILARAGRNMNRPGAKFANSTRAPAPAVRPTAPPTVRPAAPAARPASQAARPNDPGGSYPAPKPTVAPAPTAVAKPTTPAASSIRQSATAPAPQVARSNDPAATPFPRYSPAAAIRRQPPTSPAPVAPTTAATTETGPRPIATTPNPPPAMSIAPPAPSAKPTPSPTSPPPAKKPAGDKDLGSMAGFMNEETKPVKMSLENMLRKSPPGTASPKGTIKESFDDFLKTKLPGE